MTLRLRQLNQIAPQRSLNVNSEADPRRAGAEIIGFGARFIRELAEIRLRSGNEEESARPVPRVRCIDRPDVDILLLRATDGGIEIRAPEIKISAKIVDPGGD